jgi:hypothetical protein
VLAGWAASADGSRRLWRRQLRRIVLSGPARPGHGSSSS